VSTIGRSALGAFVAIWISGCAWMYPTAVPIRTQAYPSAAGRTATTLLILLPGRGDKAEAFAEHGFVSEVRAAGAGADVDVVAVDAHLGYYMKDTIVDRVWTDVVEPARRQGYQHLWIAGISMGGLGALAIARVHADAFDRVILLAPFVGPKDLLQKIASEGGPARWTPTDPHDPYQQLWLWLKGYAEPAAKLPALTLGFGKEDRLAPGHRLLAQLLPPHQVLEGEGGHDWGTWRKLWHRYWAPTSALPPA
jgi:pimeloyl-ACP methyl ester carboxylesterase